MTKYDKNPTNLTPIKKEELDKIGQIGHYKKGTELDKLDTEPNKPNTIKSDTNDTKWYTKKSDRCDTIKSTQFNTLKNIDWSIKELDWSIVEIDWQKEAETMEKIYNEWIESYKILQ